MITIEPSPDEFAFTVGGRPSLANVPLWTRFRVFTEDCFSGRLTSVTGKPREVAPFPRVNPLTGPIALDGVCVGDTVAIHLAAVTPARDWGVSTVSPDFGALSGTVASPNLQTPTEERVWIWQVDQAAGRVHTVGEHGAILRAPLAPFHGTVAVAPAYDEVLTSVVPGRHGGNLDLPILRPGTTLYLRANVDQAMLSLGDGHFAQGDGEFAGTAVEGAMLTELIVGALDASEAGAELLWPRLETEDDIMTVGCGRPLEEAFRVAVHDLVRWVATECGLSTLDAYQLVSQSCRARLGNLVNPSYTVAVSLSKALLPGGPAVMAGLHARLRSAVAP